MNSFVLMVDREFLICGLSNLKQKSKKVSLFCAQYAIVKSACDVCEFDLRGMCKMIPAVIVSRHVTTITPVATCHD